MISFKKLLGNVELATTEWSTDTRQPDKATLAAIGAVEAFLPEGLTGKVTLMSDAVMRPVRGRSELNGDGLMHLERLQKSPCRPLLL